MRRTQCSINFLLLLALLLCSSLSRPGEPNDGNLPGPGREVPFVFEGDQLVLFVPQDYNDINLAPVIFYYPGQGGTPSTRFFQAVTESKGFIIVGMSYTYEPKAPANQGRYINYLRSETMRMGKIKKHLKKDLGLRIDDGKLFIAGISKGGWFTSEVIQLRPQPWAGAVIIAAGRTRGTQYPGVRHLRDKPIYIGAGETDVNRPSAEKARTFYQRAGAVVTFEIYEGLGHDAKPDSVVLRDWLKNLTK